MEKAPSIDIEHLIASKNPKLLKFLPRFVIGYLKRILHQDEINDFLQKSYGKKNEDFCVAAAEYLNITYEVKNIEKIPTNGKVVLAMNHPLGGMDAIILVAALRNHRKDLSFIVNDILLNLEGMKEMFVGVNKVRKSKNKTNPRQEIIDLFHSDKAVCIFPAGMVSRRKKGRIEDLKWRKSFVTYSKQSKRDIVPIFIDGELSNFFYRLSNFRTFMGIKANIEMLYLSNELFKQRNKHFTFYVGDKVEHKELMQEPNDFKLTKVIREKVYELRKTK